MTTIRHLLRGQGTEEQLRILEVADVLFTTRCGRYFGGVLTEDEITTLTRPATRRS